jgi:ABC-type spermidine/putrescine transport system permease subunit I
MQGSADIEVVPYAEKRRTRSGFRSAVLLVLYAVFVAQLIVIVLPIIATAYLSLQGNAINAFEGSSLKNYFYLFEKSYYLNAIWRTVYVSAVSTVIAVLLGYPTAIALNNIPPAAASGVMILLTLPILSGPLVVVLGWMVLLADSGAVNRTLEAIGVGSVYFLGAEIGTIIGIIHFILPFVVFAIFGSLQRVPPAIVEAARTLGANQAQAFLKVVLPLTLPGIAAAAVIGFSISISSFVAPHYLGGPTQPVLTSIVGDFILGTYNNQMAATVSVILLILSFAVISLLTVVLSSKRAR